LFEKSRCIDLHRDFLFVLSIAQDNGKIIQMKKAIVLAVFFLIPFMFASAQVFENDQLPSADEQFDTDITTPADPFISENIYEDNGTQEAVPDNIEKATPEDKLDTDTYDPSDRYMNEPLDYDKDQASSWSDLHDASEIK